MSSWQPIETAPKDESVMVWATAYRFSYSGKTPLSPDYWRHESDKGWPEIAYWSTYEGGHWEGELCEPGTGTERHLRATHWQPLPEPPHEH